MTDLRWRHAAGILDCSRGRLVGIVNANPDSFSDGGAHAGTEAAVAHGLRLAEQGADVVEVGGESLRFAPPSPPEVEIGRVVPVVERLSAALDVPVAIDTYKPPVARGGDRRRRRDPQRPHRPAGPRDGGGGRRRAASAWWPPTSSARPRCAPPSFPDVDVPAVVAEWARERVGWAAERGIPPERMVIDPGVGLGKSPPQDLELLRRLDEVVGAGRPVLVPISNKKVLGAITGAAAAESAGRDGRRHGVVPDAWGDPVPGTRGAGSSATPWRWRRPSSRGRPERWHDVEK